MSKTYKLIEVVGTSPKSFAEAAQNAVVEAGKTVKAVGWFEVVQLGGRVEGGRIDEYQAKVKVGFKLLSPEELEK